MAEPLRHRQTKEAATDLFSLQPPRHISTLPFATEMGCPGHFRSAPNFGHSQRRSACLKGANTGILADPWVVSSLLQKSIRRGDAAIAQRAAHTLFKLKGSSIWRRLMVIAFEDKV